MTQHKNQKSTNDGRFTVHISLESGLGQILESLAEKDKRSVSNMVLVLLYEALEAREQETN